MVQQRALEQTGSLLESLGLVWLIAAVALATAACQESLVRFEDDQGLADPADHQAFEQGAWPDMRADQGPEDQDAAPDIAPDAPPDAASDAGSDPPPEAWAWSAPSHITLPYASVGQPLPQATLCVAWRGELAPGASRLGATILSGPFELLGSPQRAVDDRGRPCLQLTVRAKPPADSPKLLSGQLQLTADGQPPVTAQLGAVIGRAQLPEPVWRSVPGGRVASVRLPTAPFPHRSAPYQDDSVMIAVPDGLELSQGVDVVLHLHGHRAQLERTEASQHLVRLFLAASRDAVLVIPQGPVNAASGDFGKLMEPGGAQALLTDVIAILYRVPGQLPSPQLGQVVITAHSGGYLAAARLLTLGQLDVRAVHLFDALYGQLDVFRAFALRPQRWLRSNHTPSGQTRSNNLTLAQQLGAQGLQVGQDLLGSTLTQRQAVVAPSAFSHNDCVWTERTSMRWLMAGPLRASALAPPQLLSAQRDEGASTATLRWRVMDHSGVTLTVEGAPSASGPFEVLAQVDARGQALGQAQAPGRAAMRLRAWRMAPRTQDGVAWAWTPVGSEPSRTYGAAGRRWLVVDGFDRLVGSSWGRSTHDFAARYVSALGDDASTVWHEALMEGLASTSGYQGVLWFLGDEGLTDHTLEPAERAIIEQVLARGQRLILTGAEVGYATDAAWLERVLGVRLVRDSAQAMSAAGMRFGEVYPEDFPDVLSGPQTLWSYDNGAGGAAVGRAARHVVVGFGLETMRDVALTQAVSALASWVLP